MVLHEVPICTLNINKLRYEYEAVLMPNKNFSRIDVDTLHFLTNITLIYIGNNLII